MSRFPALALLSLLTIAASPVRAAESFDGCIGTIVSLPVTLTSQGTYCLTKNLATAMSGGDAVIVGTSNVTLDCNGFRIQGTAAGLGTQATGVRVANKLNFTLRNCSIRGFRFGVNITGAGSGGHLLADNRFDGNTQYAIHLQGTGNTVRRNLIIDSGAMTAEGETGGIVANGNNDLIDNTIDGVMPSSGGTQAGSYGIRVSGSTTSVIQGNRIRNINGGNSADYGIYATSGTFVAVDGNQLSIGSGGGNGNFGIHCGHPAIVTGNRLFGYGIALVNCNNDSDNIIKP